MPEKTGAVVVGVDGSDGAMSAARWGAAVAERFETSLHIVHAMPSFGRNLTDTVAAVRAAAMSYLRDYANIILRSAADAVREQQPGLFVTTESTDTPVDEALIQLSRGACMIVVGNSEVTPAGALLVGSTNPRNCHACRLPGRCMAWIAHGAHGSADRRRDGRCAFVDCRPGRGVWVRRSIQDKALCGQVMVNAPARGRCHNPVLGRLGRP